MGIYILISVHIDSLFICQAFIIAKALRCERLFRWLNVFDLTPIMLSDCSLERHRLVARLTLDKKQSIIAERFGLLRYMYELNLPHILSLSN